MCITVFNPTNLPGALKQIWPTASSFAVRVHARIYFDDYDSPKIDIRKLAWFRLIVLEVGYVGDGNYGIRWNAFSWPFSRNRWRGDHMPISDPQNQEIVGKALQNAFDEAKNCVLIDH